MKIKRIAAEDTIDLRHRVMWPDLPREQVVLPDDAAALHFGAFLDGQLIGVGSFFEGDNEADHSCRLRKLAVEPQFQSKGVASALLEVAIQDLRAMGCKAIWCDARVSASKFYARNGFHLDARVFQKNGLDYVLARRDF